jgi:hypothetical protein
MTWLRRRPKERRLEAGELPARWPDPDRKDPDTSQFLISSRPIETNEVDVLGRYNAEVARGIQHTPEWQAYMADLQQRFDARQGEKP